MKPSSNSANFWTPYFQVGIRVGFDSALFYPVTVPTAQ